MQLDLFRHVAAAYSASDDEIPNAELYQRVAADAGIDPDVLERRSRVGRAGQQHSLVKRAIRWAQQDLKALGLIERVPGARGVWRFADISAQGLTQSRTGVRLIAFSTRLGVAIWGACETAFAGMEEQITAIITSPPYPLRKPRAYGNPSQEEYTDFICRALEPLIGRLVPGGSVALNLSNDCFVPGSPARSLYREHLVLALAKRFSLHKMDEIIWAKESPIPGPTEWASKRRVQLNAGYEVILWMTNDPHRVRTNNRRVLQPNTERHMRLMHGGGERRNAKYGGGAYKVKPGAFGRVTAGTIPRNVICESHTCTDSDQYRSDAKRLVLPFNEALQPLAIADFLVRFLADVGDIIVDPFGGSGTTAIAAEKHNRRWAIAEVVLEYLRGAAERFRSFPGFHIPTAIDTWRPRASAR